MFVQHVVAANIDLQKSSLSIKIPNTFNSQETVQEGVMNFPDRLHKGFLDEIIHRGGFEFIKDDKDGI